jgi:hypothetical protein
VTKQSGNVLGGGTRVENCGRVDLHNCALIEDSDAIGQCESL